MQVTSTLRRTTVSSAVTALALVGAAVPTAAAAPGNHLELEHFDDHEAFTSAGGEDFGCDLPFDVDAVFDEQGTFRLSLRRDGLAYGHVTVRSTSTFSANGHTFVNVSSVVDKDRLVVDEGTTLRITGQAAGGSRWYVDGKLAFRDPGMVRYQVRIDHGGTPNDPADDEFVEDLGLLKGSTGLNETEGRDFCDDLATFLAP